MVSILRKSLQEYRNTGAATLAQLKHKAPWLLLVLGGVAQVPAQAALSDSFHPFVGVGYNYDDNLFRLPDAVAGDASQRSDRSRNVFAGLQFEHVYGRQAFEVSAQTSQVSFDRYSALNYNAKDLSGAWRWQLGNHLEGQLGGTLCRVSLVLHGFSRNCTQSAYSDRCLFRGQIPFPSELAGAWARAERQAGF